MQLENEQNGSEGAANGASLASEDAGSGAGSGDGGGAGSGEGAGNSAPEYDVSQFGESYVADGKLNFETVAQRLKAADEAEAGLAELRGERPENPDGYQIALPDIGIKDDSGQPIQIDDKDPAAALLRQTAHDRGWGQKDVDAVTGVYGEVLKGMHAASQAEMAENKKAEFAKIHADPAEAQKTVDAAVNGLVETFGEEAKPLAAVMLNAEAVAAVQHIIAKANGTESGNPKPGSGGDRKPTSKVLFGGET